MENEILNEERLTKYIVQIRKKINDYNTETYNYGLELGLTPYESRFAILHCTSIDVVSWIVALDYTPDEFKNFIESLELIYEKAREFGHAGNMDA